VLSLKSNLKSQIVIRHPLCRRWSRDVSGVRERHKGHFCYCHVYSTFGSHFRNRSIPHRNLCGTDVPCKRGSWLRVSRTVHKHIPSFDSPFQFSRVSGSTESDWLSWEPCNGCIPWCDSPLPETETGRSERTNKQTNERFANDSSWRTDWRELVHVNESLNPPLTHTSSEQTLSLTLHFICFQPFYIFKIVCMFTLFTPFRLLNPVRLFTWFKLFHISLPLLKHILT
jgi:hypothetical protein